MIRDPRRNYEILRGKSHGHEEKNFMVDVCANLQCIVTTAAKCIFYETLAVLSRLGNTRGDCILARGRLPAQKHPPTIPEWGPFLCGKKKSHCTQNCTSASV